MTNDEFPALDPVAATASDAELDKLIADANETYTVAAQLGNLSAASQALSVRLRGLSEKAERESARQEKGALLDGVDPRSPTHEWPRELAHFVQQYTDGLLERLEEVEKFRAQEKA